MDKAFYVSPFIEMRGGYEVRVRDEPARLRITINQHQPEGLELHASLDLARRPLTDRNLLRLLLRHPFLPQRTTALIHWHALRLWLRGARFRRHREVATMNSPTLPVDRAAASGLLDRLAWRVALAAAERIRIGRLRVVLPDGSVQTFGGDARRRIGGDPDPRPRGADPHPRRRRDRGRRGLHGRAVVQPGPACPAPARGPQPGGARAVRRLVPGPGAAGPDDRASGPAQHPIREPQQHRRPLRPGQRLLPAVPRRDADLLERGVRVRRTSRWPTPSATSTGSSPPTPGCAPASTSWRSARAGAASPSTRRASWAAG